MNVEHRTPPLTSTEKEILHVFLTFDFPKGSCDFLLDKLPNEQMTLEDFITKYIKTTGLSQYYNMTKKQDELTQTRVILPLGTSVKECINQFREERLNSHGKPKNFFSNFILIYCESTKPPELSSIPLHLHIGKDLTLNLERILLQDSGYYAGQPSRFQILPSGCALLPPNFFPRVLLYKISSKAAPSSSSSSSTSSSSSSSSSSSHFSSHFSSTSPSSSSSSSHTTATANIVQKKNNNLQDAQSNKKNNNIQDTQSNNNINNNKNNNNNTPKINSECGSNSKLDRTAFFKEYLTKGGKECSFNQSIFMLLSNYNNILQLRDETNNQILNSVYVENDIHVLKDLKNTKELMNFLESQVSGLLKPFSFEVHSSSSPLEKEIQTYIWSRSDLQSLTENINQSKILTWPKKLLILAPCKTNYNSNNYLIEQIDFPSSGNLPAIRYQLDSFIVKSVIYPPHHQVFYRHKKEFYGHCPIKNHRISLNTKYQWPSKTNELNNSSQIIEIQNKQPPSIFAMVYKRISNPPAIVLESTANPTLSDKNQNNLPVNNATNVISSEKNQNSLPFNNATNAISSEKNQISLPYNPATKSRNSNNPVLGNSSQISTSTKEEFCTKEDFELQEKHLSLLLAAKLLS